VIAAIPREWVLHLPIDLPSANRHGGAATNARHAANAAQYRRQRASYVTALSMLAHYAGVPVGVEAFRHITIVRLWGKGCRAWDDDNMVAAAKGIRDAMQRSRTVTRKGVTRVIPGAGLIVDDSAKWARFEYAQEKAPDGKPGVRVVVREVGP
jgi:hypothetical protein